MLGLLFWRKSNASQKVVHLLVLHCNTMQYRRLKMTINKIADDNGYFCILHHTVRALSFLLCSKVLRRSIFIRLFAKLKTKSVLQCLSE